MALALSDGDGRVRMRRGTAGPRGGGVYLSRVQQTRLLDAAVALVAEEGLTRLKARRVSARAGMSTKTFYDLFADSEDCFLAVFDRAVDELAEAAAPAWTAQGEWVQRVRGALTALLASLERDPAVAKVVFVEALGAGPRVLTRRAEVLERVARFLDEGRVGSPLAEELPSLVAAGVAGAAFSIVHARLVEQRSGSLMELAGPVMATVVLPYRGREASAGELARPVPELPERAASAESSGPRDRPGGSGVDGPPLGPVRVTERTCMVLAAVGEHGGANNRQVAAGAGASEPQISRLLPRLAEHGLVENRAGGKTSLSKAWWLTASGAELLRTGRTLAVGEQATGRALSVGRGKSRSAGVVRGARVGHRAAKRAAIKGGVLLAGMDSVEYRRGLLLRAAAAAVDEHGYGAVTVAHITARAKISRRTFYELFVDREHCLLAVMQDIEEQLTTELQAAELGVLEWRERVRMGLWTVLRFFDREPALARFCVVESARGDDRMTAFRAELLARITGVIAQGGEESLVAEISPLVAEGIAGAVVSIVGTRLAATGGAGRRAAGRSRKNTESTGPLSDLLGELMGLVALPYLGAGLAQEERARPAPRIEGPVERPGRSEDDSSDSREGGASRSRTQGEWRATHASDRGRRDAPPIASVRPLRMTYRTALVLEAIARAPGISNLGVARHAQINDQGQVSKLLSRLERHGLVQNTGRGQTQGAPNEWRLTPAGQTVERGIHDHQEQAA